MGSRPSVNRLERVANVADSRPGFGQILDKFMFDGIQVLTLVNKHEIVLPGGNIPLERHVKLIVEIELAFVRNDRLETIENLPNGVGIVVGGNPNPVLLDQVRSNILGLFSRKHGVAP